jgi:hypothetical protein
MMRLACSNLFLRADSSERRLLSREDNIDTPLFFSEASCQLKLFWASLPVQGLEHASQAFSEDGFLRVIKRESP